MINENELIDIIDDQAHAIQKICEMLREERLKKHVILENCKITGDRFIVDGNTTMLGEIELDLKEPFETKGNLDARDCVFRIKSKSLPKRRFRVNNKIIKKKKAKK